MSWRGGSSHLSRGSVIFRNHLAPILGEIRNGNCKTVLNRILFVEPSV
jgi:hypothetical protein